jgi:hypothetical protein
MPLPIPPLRLLPSSSLPCSSVWCDKPAAYSLSGKHLCERCDAARIGRDCRRKSAMCLAAVGLFAVAAVVSLLLPY